MSIFGKKKEAINTAVTEQPIVSPKVVDQIQIMPSRFVAVPDNKNNKLFIIIGIIIIIIGGIVASALWVYKSMNLEPVAVDDSTNADQNLSADINANAENQNVNTINSNVNAGVDINAPANNNANQDVNVNTLANSNAAISLNANTNANTAPPVDGTLDLDNDKLSINEEKIFLTSDSSRDSDGDTYADGDEVQNGYDPAQAGKALSGSSVVANYANSTYKFSILYPSQWAYQELTGANNLEIDFDSKIGDLVKLIIYDNTDKAALSKWITEHYPAVNMSQMADYQINNFKGLKDQDATKYFLASPDAARIFVLTYEVSFGVNPSYATVFKMMVGSLKPQ